MIKLLELHPVRGATREILLPGPTLIAEKIKEAVKYENKTNIIAYASSESIINSIISMFEAAGYTKMRLAFNNIKSMGIADVTEVEFWTACISMGREGFSTNVELTDFTDFTE